MERLTYEIMDMGYCVDGNETRKVEIENNVFVTVGNAIDRLANLENSIERDNLVAVVRCKSCLHWHKGMCEFHSCEMDEYDFCNYADTF